MSVETFPASQTRRARAAPPSATRSSERSSVASICRVAQSVADPAGRTPMCSALSALIQCAHRKNRWRVLDAMAVDQGLQCVADLYPQLPAEAMTWAFQEMRRTDERVAASFNEAVPA